ncbi:hypothetical protein ACFFS2_30830 [Streptomyces aurantiacus]|uniref:Uncharacterized protein n=1 Tax=Streptomyces aurantiacus TaxID=47760 RepID=A0A7G1P3V8_9ACTN|nr:hypothetical protein [Streptomyces aurantiacus]BCL28497.1 hypothetical protein GCM10017557_33560 [Streptomyces aurantiacus]
MADRHSAHHAPATEQPSPLDTARECFTLLVTGPQPLSLDGRSYPGLPNRRIPLDELRDRMLRRRCPRSTRDEVWAHLVRQSREQGATWTLACAGMALPALSGVSRWLAARFPGDLFDLHAEVLSGFLGALTTIDVDRPRVLVRLRWAAYRAGFAALSEALDAPMPVASAFRSAAPKPPWGHPDLVLARAVRQSVLTRTEADLIGATRLDETLITDWADRHLMSHEAAYKARQRAERRLVAFLREQSAATDPDDPVASCLVNGLAPQAPPPRPTRKSLCVTTVGQGGPAGAGEKSAATVSKSGADSGLLGCGESTPALASRVSPEVPRCA